MNAITKNEDLLDAIKSSKLGAQIEADIAKQRLAARKALEAELAGLNAAAAESFPQHVAAVDAAIAEVREAERALREANDRLAAANFARSAASSGYTYRRHEIEAELTAGASPLLSEFRSWVLDELEATRKKNFTRRTPFRNPITGEATQQIDTNTPAVNARVGALNRALDAIAEQRLQADQTNVAAWIESVKNTLPTVD